MRCTGPKLFSSEELWSALVEHTSAAVGRSVIGVLIEYSLVARLHLKRVALAELTPVQPLRLSDCSTFRPLRPQPSGYAWVEVSCTVQFTGEPFLFDCSPAIWPEARQVRGAVEGSALTLVAEGHTGDEEWFGTVLASELAEIHRVIAAQDAQILHFGREREGIVRSLVDRAYPNIDMNELMKRYDASMAIAGPDDLYVKHALATWEQAKRSLWQQWTSDS